MKARLMRLAIVVCAILALPVVGYAQEATLSGVVTDATRAVLPGVSVKALHEASGNTFEAVTDQRGAYRIPANWRLQDHRRAGRLQDCHAEGVELLVGQTATINLQMVPGGVAESVTVTARRP